MTMKKKASHKKTRKPTTTGFQVIENECIWMKAGVINFRLCDNAYDCSRCPFDKSMRLAMGEITRSDADPPRLPWAQNLTRQHDGASRPCRHVLSGRVDAPKICVYDYECCHCLYDQWLDECDLLEEAGVPVYKLASGYKIAEGYYYHKGHSWVFFEHGGIARVGFDDFAVRLFGVMDAIEAPTLGQKLKQGQPGWRFSREGLSAAVMSPTSASVLAVNHKLLDYPEIAHNDPYRNGWLCIVEPDFPKKDIKGLYYGSESFNWMETESRKLMRLLGPEYEDLASTGGEPIGDVFGNFREVGWDRLVETFLEL
jgi:glycine cleavage system H lipoate-binding protein